MKLVYLDNAATTKISNKVLEKMMELNQEDYGNPSSVHRLGQRAKGLIERSRTIVAKEFGVENKEIIFTSGGAEGNNLILQGIAKNYRYRGKHIITTEIEHPTVLETCKYLEKIGYDVTYLDVDENGIINLETLKKSLREDTIIVSIMYANNETGVKQPIREVGEILKDKDILFHSDGIQAIGKEKINLKELNIDAFTGSAHKFYGPKGVGFIYLDKNYSLEKQIFGGSQERNNRSGTENVIGVSCLGVALEEVYTEIEQNITREKKLLQYLEDRLKKEIKKLRINGESEERIGNISNITVEGCDIQTLLIALDMRGICISGGSACMSGAQSESHVLKAMGKSSEDLKSSFRISIGKYTTKEEIDFFIENLKEIVKIERGEI